ncbi:MAG: hypothetical protein JJU28_16985 [Cyclobacteriaceae bacterium]|nr:hypothetical protein [Cyclobacteriaceae bacterium]
MIASSGLQRWLAQSRWRSTMFIALAAFLTYSCMYAFRKPFAAGTFEGLSFLNIDYKVWLITAQSVGYTLSKFLGIRLVSEMKKGKRAAFIFLLISIAQGSLLLFALIPPPYNILMLFANGLPLGMVWGIVFSYIEGRRNTEFLGAVLCISFIFSSGFVKSIGKYLMVSWNVGELSMPFITGLLFTLPTILFIWLLQQSPEPDAEDIASRVERKPMTRMERLAIYRQYAPGLIMIIITYTLLTAFRDFRDNFSAEIWQSLGMGDSSSIFTITEIPVSILILIVMASLMFIRNHANAFMVSHLIIIAGFCTALLSTYAFDQGLISPTIWMILMGSGLYLGYVPFNTIFFDRFIATFRLSGNVGFLIYLADSFGYLGSLGVLFFKNFTQPDISWFHFFRSSAYMAASAGIFFTCLSLMYFQYKSRMYSNVKLA